MSKTDPVAPKLKALREEAGISIRDMAELLEMPSFSTYKLYETRYKKSFLPQDIAQKLALILKERGMDSRKALELGAIPQTTQRPGFSEGRQPRIDVSVLLDDPSTPTNLVSDTGNTVKLAIVDDKIQIAATVDADGFDELIRRLELARRMIE